MKVDDSSIDWKQFKEWDLAVEEVCRYLRIRRYVDGVFLFMNKPFEYKSREFKRILKIMAAAAAGNYFGVAFNKAGIQTDTLFPEFWFAYRKHPYEYWMENGKALRNLIKKYRKQYIRRHGFERGGPQEEEYWQRIYHTEHLKGLKEYNKVHDPDNDYDWDPQGNLKDRLWHARKETYYTYFNWPRDSKGAARRRQRYVIEKQKDHTWQSLRGFDALTNKYHVLMDDRYALLSFCGPGTHREHAQITLFDFKLMREHQFIHAYTNEMSEDTSIYDGFKDLMNVFEYATKIDFKNKTIAVPEFIDNPRKDRHSVRKVFSGGGYVEHGDPFGDSIAAEIMAGEFVLTTKCVESIGSGCRERGAEILTIFMRHFEANHKSRILKEE